MKQHTTTRLLILLLFAIIPLKQYAQSANPYDLEQYQFIKYDKNKILFPGDSADFNRLFRKFDTLLIKGEGQINTIHIGGSHIQADIYSNHTRERFQLMGQGVNGGRGMLFPFSTAKTNNPSNYKVFDGGLWTSCKNTQSQSKYTCELGLTGISVTASDTSAWIHFILNGFTKVDYTYKKVKIFYACDSLSYLPVPGKKYGFVNSKVYPDQGYIEYEMDSAYREFTLELKKTDSLQQRFVLQGVYFDDDAPGFVYNAIGVNGAKLESFLRCEDLAKQTAVIQPDLVVLSIGTNDAYTRRFDGNKFVYEYRKLIHRIKEAAPDAAVIITVPNDCYLYRRYVNENTPVQEKLIINLAEELGAGVWDFYEIMGGLNSSQAWYYSDIMKYDRIHFNRQGYLLKGDLFFTAIMDAYDKHLNSTRVPYDIPDNLEHSPLFKKPIGEEERNNEKVIDDNSTADR